MKSLILTALVLSLGLIFFFYRRRLRLAILVAGSVYIVLTIGRFILIRDETDRFDELALAIAVMAAAWLVTYLITRLIHQHRERKARQRGPAR